MPKIADGTMRSVPALFGVVLLAVAGSWQVVIGTVDSATTSTLKVRSSAGVYTLSRDSGTKIWRGRYSPDFSVLHPGDEVVIRYRREPDGRLVVIELNANIDHITGIITQVRGSGFQVDQNFDADPRSGYRRGYREITYNPETVFEESAAEDLRAGRTVDIIGLKVDRIAVQATRIIIYDGHKPVRMRPGRVLLPNGSLKE
jgi:hypothetical protein